MSHHYGEDNGPTQEPPNATHIFEKMNSGEQLAYMGTDAAKWAHCFSVMAYLLHDQKGQKWSELLDPDPGEWLFGWFANALGAGESHGYSKGLKDGEEEGDEDAEPYVSPGPVELTKQRLHARGIRQWTLFLDQLPHRLPSSVINHITMGNLGRLTVTDPSLHNREVPTITVEEIGVAMRRDEGQVV